MNCLKLLSKLLHNHHIVLLARTALTLSRHFSLSFIASGRSSGLHRVFSHSCWMYVCADRPAFALPYVGVHRSTSLMSSSLLLQQCPACLVHLTWIVFMMGGRWPYSWCLVNSVLNDKKRKQPTNQPTIIDQISNTLLQRISKRILSTPQISHKEKDKKTRINIHLYKL